MKDVFKIVWLLLWFFPVWAAFLLYITVLAIAVGPRKAGETWDALV